MKLLNSNYNYYPHTKINNLKELLYLGFKDHPDDIAFSFSENNIKIKKTYKDVYNDVLNLSGYFYKNYKNRHIALVSENSYNYIITFLSIILSGNVCVVIDKDISENDLDNLLKISDTKIIYYSMSYCLFIKDTKYASFQINNLDEYIKIGKNVPNKYKIDDNKDAAIFFTSGTTGANKAVALSQKSIAYDIYAASSLFKPEGIVVSVLPYHHAFGLITSVLKPFYYDTEVYICKSLKYMMRDFKENKPGTLFMVPAIVEMIYRQIWKNARQNKTDKLLKNAIRVSNSLLKVNIDIRRKLFKNILDEFGGNLKYIICGGAYLDKKYVKWFRSIGIEILNGYGITECSPVVAVNRNNCYKDGSVGQICKDIDVKIIDKEICVSGPIVMNGYYKDKKSTNEVIKDGYFHTGDLGYIDRNGFLYITGRKKNLIILTNGENISPELIESELLKDNAVEEAVVYEEANKLVVSILPSEEYLTDQEYFDNLINNYNKDKPKNHQIALVKLRTEQFIKNNNGKILRNKVMEEKHERRNN